MKPLQAYLTEIGARVEECLNDLVPRGNLPYSQLFESARYSLFAPARRLHPIFAVATAEMLGCDSETALIPACALEMVHTYARIGDTKPEGQTLLAGNYLLTRAFEVCVAAPDLSAHQKLTLVEILSSRAGAYGMIGGQTLDLDSAGQQIDLDTLQTVHALKTAALITASFEFGGVLGDADEETMMILQTCGEALGLAYQITEDILDEDPHKTTYVSLLGPNQAQQTAEYLAECAFDAIEALPGDPTLLLQLAELITEPSR
jgi:geranylgeranyl diphosphate synthase, type II